MAMLHVPRPVLHIAQSRILLTPELESCGFLVGRADEREAWVDEVVFATNISPIPDQFAISPREHRQVLREIRDGRQLVGLFHSHRGSPSPSDADREGMDLVPVIWMIIGHTGQRCATRLELAAFQRQGGALVELVVDIV